MAAIKAINLGIRFLLEMCCLAILGYWGFRTGAQPLTRTVLGLGSPILFATVWGVLMAPKSSSRLAEPWRVILEIFLFSLTTWALWRAGTLLLAVIFGTIYVLNKVLMVLWRQT